jgi:hypothetical protein
MSQMVNVPASGKESATPLVARIEDGSPPLPERGIPGGWIDPWEEDPLAAARAEVAEIKNQVRAARRTAKLERERDRRFGPRSRSA